MRLALGFSHLLDEFAAQHDALTYKDWKDVEWRDAVVRAAADPSTEIYWNLSGIDVRAGLLRAVSDQDSGLRTASASDWELLQFCQNAEWRSRTVFFVDGSRDDDPFADLAWCQHDE